jgi:hypothetical protein
MGMDIFRHTSRSVEFSLAFTFLPLMVKVTIEKIPVRGALRPKEQRIAALKDCPFGA